MDDQDIAGLLPDPPPPRASRREAAIGAAMRRFDGLEPEPAEAPRPAARQRPIWMRPNRTQIGAFASIALVAVVGIPLALNSLGEQFPAGSRSAPTSAVATYAPPATQPPTAPPQLQAVAPEQRVAASEPRPAVSAPPALAEPAPVRDCGKGDCMGAPEPAGNREPNRFTAMKRAESAVAPEPPSPVPMAARSAAARPAAEPMAPGFAAPAPPPPPPAQTALAAADLEERSVVVTGSRVGRASSTRRGDWNACTVADPNRSLGDCRRIATPRAKGPAGDAAGRLAEGLERAWRGDLDGAIASFDAALALQPKMAAAYLNRGLAYQRQGQLDRALADLDRAIRYAPSARGFYNRSLIHRQRGNARRADADLDRAVEIDSRYAALAE